MIHILVWLYACWEYLNGTHISLALCHLGIFDLNDTQSYKFNCMLSGNF